MEENNMGIKLKTDVQRTNDNVTVVPPLDMEVKVENNPPKSENVIINSANTNVYVNSVKEEDDNKKVPSILIGLLAMIMLATYTFTLKNYEPARNIIITGGIMVYPISFILMSIICKNYGFKEARKAVFLSSILYVSFFILIMIGVMPIPNTYTTGYNAVVQFLFANNFVDIGNSGLSFFYPTLGQFFGVLVSYIVSHLLYATVYNAVHKSTIDYLAMGLSLFIAYIIDRIIFIPILFAKGLKDGSNTFDYLIKCLTSEFMFAILMCILIVIVYLVYSEIKKKKATN